MKMNIEPYAISEKTIYDICTLLTDYVGKEPVYHDGFVTIDSGKGAIYPRHILTADAKGRSEEVIGNIMELVKAGGPGYVSYTEEIAGSEHRAALEKHGFVNFMSQVGMYLEIDKHVFKADLSPVIRIGEDRFDEWENTLNTAFPKPSERDALELLVKDPRVAFFGYEADGKIVGTAMAYCKDGICGMHEGGILPEYRGKHLFRSLLEKCIMHGKENGCEIAALQSNDTGYPSYIACGFIPAGQMPNWRLEK
ncbi:MAG: GNAT family N-acetyltransferase [Oscillospiraceae bacterium]|nr:GNAT family N-acetyltransferase [Oscillospiraceae bacterium]